jgi:hypothetical protein
MAATQLGAVGELEKALAVDQHGIEPIPDDDRDSTAWRQFWIWSVPTSRRLRGWSERSGRSLA